MDTLFPRHIPVLLTPKSDDGLFAPNTVMSELHLSQDDAVLDVTLGLGGHSEAFLGELTGRGLLYAMDADQENLLLAQKRLQKWATRCTFIHANFRSVGDLHLPSMNVIFADLGVSSPHLDDPLRGFTFREDAPLDLRFDRSQGITAAEFLCSASEDQLCRVFRMYGELRDARRIAKTIFHTARSAPDALTTTFGVRALLEQLWGFRAKSLLPQFFQALRIHVNDELGALTAFLAAAPDLLAAGGRLGIISYHSLEDRLVKDRFRALTTPQKNVHTGAVEIEAAYELLTRKAIVPTEDECLRNPRARSARFRILRRR